MYNTMFRAFSPYPHRCIDYYTRFLSDRLFPDKFTFPSVIRSCSMAFDLLLCQQMHNHVLKFGFDSDIFVVNNILTMYCNLAELGYARKVFDESIHLVDVISWTSLITGCWNLEETELAQMYFARMPCKNVVAWNAMISGYLRTGKIIEAQKTFDEMPKRDVASWSAMISGYSQCGMFSEALRVFKEMIHVALVVPNVPALVSAVTACAQLRVLEEGVWIHDYIVENRFEIGVTLGTALLDMYGKCGCVEKAVGVFKSMVEKNVLSWNSMIAGLGMNGYGRLGLSLFWKMQQVGPNPNWATFVALLSGCSHSGLVDEGLRVFDVMVRKFEINPQSEHYGCVVDLLGRAGLIEEALRFVEEMPIEPHVELWGALIGACCLHGDAEIGEEVGKKLVELDSRHTGRYAALCKILKIAQKWDDAETVRNLLRDRKLLKLPGNSVIELQ